ncbi:replication protein [Paenibacillus sp. GCM10012307]|uniref:Replication protein n=1 Tax=Paenibacillus roseus TaxID=2798579 RepID=A0A934IXJ3_9BACL|nr:replication protein [Paenibacillus roseus]MBJ6361111.1 replication protein [Paenibacillus roseus]
MDAPQNYLNKIKTNGFTAISNSIYQQLIQRDFTKRQLSVLLMILRLSYGCQRSNAYIPKLISFELCGVGKTNITNVLNSLVKQKVLHWDKIESTFAINQNVQDWEIEVVSGWESEVFQHLLRLNLKKGSQNNNQFELLSNQNENCEIIEIITENNEHLSNQLLESPTKPYESKREDIPKESIKETNTEIAVYRATSYETVEREYCSLHGKRSLSGKDREVIEMFSLNGIPINFIIQRMRETYAKKIERGETVNSFAYYERPILDSWRTLNTTKATPTMREQPSRYQSRQERQNEMLLLAIREELDDTE